MTLPRVLLVPAELDLIISSLEDDYRVLRMWERPADDDLAQTRALICLGHQSPEKLIPLMPKLELVASFTTGYDGIDVDTLHGSGIKVSHAPGATAEPVAEFALALILAAYRNVVAGDRLLRSGAWADGWKPLIGRSLDGARIGIVGLGAIGSALARRCQMLGMHVSWWGPRSKADAPWPQAPSLEELARDTDILAVCTSASAANIGMISAAVIDAIGPEGLLVNVARGQLVDEEALIDALKTGRLGSAALDVFAVEPTSASRWKDVPNVICTPHSAGASRSTLMKMTAMLRANLDAFFADQPLPYPVEPTVAVPRELHRAK